jgi:hypothetical protein
MRSFCELHDLTMLRMLAGLLLPACVSAVGRRIESRPEVLIQVESLHALQLSSCHCTRKQERASKDGIGAAIAIAGGGGFRPPAGFRLAKRHWSFLNSSCRARHRTRCREQHFQNFR